MAYVPIPKDLKKVKTKVAFNLTKAAYRIYHCRTCWNTCLFIYEER